MQKRQNKKVGAASECKCLRWCGIPRRQMRERERTRRCLNRAGNCRGALHGSLDRDGDVPARTSRLNRASLESARRTTSSRFDIKRQATPLKSKLSENFSRHSFILSLFCDKYMMYVGPHARKPCICAGNKAKPRTVAVLIPTRNRCNSATPHNGQLHV